MSNADQILELLKTRGPLSAAELGKSLGMTSMGARRHLQALAEQELVYWQDSVAGRGRPKRSWYLTARAMQRFPDRHAELSLQLIDSVTELFGEQGLERLISQREQQQLSQYRQALDGLDKLADKVQALAQLRRSEGYMADVEALEDGDFILLEHHCPICAAATRCQGFCRSELDIFQQLLAPLATVERQQHLLSDDLRCSYRISPC
ncbi:MAG: transcriptional regulator [Marinobacterium sp.]|nr:transcriptional regulator [Marinobacterium sp.]